MAAAQELQELRRTTINNCDIVLASGSVLDFVGDAMVNAANEGCVSGFGVDEFVNKSGGFNLKEARKLLGGCPTGQCRMTPSFNHKKTKMIFHAVGPVYRQNRLKQPQFLTMKPFDGHTRKSENNISHESTKKLNLEDQWEEEDELLASAYANMLKLGSEHSCKTIGTCLLSAGVFRGERPLLDVLCIALRSISKNIYNGLSEIWIIGYTKEEQVALLEASDLVFSDIHSCYMVPPAPPQYEAETQVSPQDQLWNIWGETKEQELQWKEAAEANFEAWKTAIAPSPSIPKIIHHVWLGSELPQQCSARVATWAKHHPPHLGWKHILWKDEHVKYASSKNKSVESDSLEGFTEEQLKFKLKNFVAFENATNYGEKSDILRYEILCQFGGIYVDCDFDCLGSFDALLPCRFFTGFSNTLTVVEINNGLIGSMPQHPLLKAAVRKITASSNRDLVLNSGNAASLISQFLDTSISTTSNHQLMCQDSDKGADEGAAEHKENNIEVLAAKTIGKTGPGMFTKLVLGALAQAYDATQSTSGPIPLLKHNYLPFDCVIFPKEWFYPIPNNESQNSNASSSLVTSSPTSTSMDFDKTMMRENELKSIWAKEVSLAVHYWDRSWI